jgi:hypothetical protein
MHPLVSVKVKSALVFQELLQQARSCPEVPKLLVLLSQVEQWLPPAVASKSKPNALPLPPFSFESLPVSQSDPIPALSTSVSVQCTEISDLPVSSSI